jgi:glycosyltransferase involved in cell wall biosynthesis
MPADRPRISAALIVRDEANTIARCLAALRPFVDEIVVVDTGSTDETKAIAARFTDRIFDFTWIDDFAAARQFAFDQATGDWVFWIDADDVLIGGEHIRPAVESAAPDVLCLMWRYDLLDEASGETLTTLWRERCVRNTGAFRWVGRVHEVLVCDKPYRREQVEAVWHEHRREQRATRSGRNLRILEAEYRELGDALSPRSCFYLANEYKDNRRWEEAVTLFSQYLRHPDTWAEERYLAYQRRGKCLWVLGRHDEAADSYLRAVGLYPLFPQAYFGLAEIAYTRKDWPVVVHWCEIGQRLPMPEMTLFVVQSEIAYDWIIHYTNALYHVGRVGDAYRWTELALQMRPDDAFHRNNRVFFRPRVDAALLASLENDPTA